MTHRLGKSAITIQDGHGSINGEWISDNVVVEDYATIPPSGHHTRGMRIDCGHGYGLGVVWGTGTYSDNMWALVGDPPFKEVVEKAEIAILGPDGRFAGRSEYGWDDDVLRHQDAEQIMYWLMRVRENARESGTSERIRKRRASRKPRSEPIFEESLDNRSPID